MKVFKLEIFIADFDELGAEEIKQVLENANYPNDCISPDVMKCESRDVEWSDDHPLNGKDTFDEAVKKLFEEED